MGPAPSDQIGGIGYLYRTVRLSVTKFINCGHGKCHGALVLSVSATLDNNHFGIWMLGILAPPKLLIATRGTTQRFDCNIALTIRTKTMLCTHLSLESEITFCCWCAGPDEETSKV